MKTVDQTLEVVLPILQGLLASGHYITPENEVDCVTVLRRDNGTDWKESGAFARRNTSMAIEHALGLADELVEQIACDNRP